ncbi:MAG: SGNH/GDSL hydrolase family protein, partial [Actinomycetota bacterium]|nr:SGNH/GDSL hydrolase family protein [Actinomycetota bacterium]
ARLLALRAAYGGGTLTGLLLAGSALLNAEIRLARRTIGTPRGQAPDPSGSYGRLEPDAEPLQLVVLGDSAAAGLGCETAHQTPGALIAGGMARDLRRRVVLRVVARTGARSADLDTQVGRALRRPVDVAFVLVGANDVTHQVAAAEAARDLARSVRTLRAAGAEVVVGTCPDLGTVKPVLQPLRTYARYASRRLAAAQTVAVVEEGGLAVSLGDLLARSFLEEPHLWSADRFHPSAAGYRRVVDAVLPSLLEAAGVAIPVSVPISDSVQDVTVAARVASREPGLAVETLEGAEGVAAAGPGRLARLTRRLPLVGRGAPAGPTPGAEEQNAAVDL